MINIYVKPANKFGIMRIMLENKISTIFYIADNYMNTTTKASKIVMISRILGPIHFSR